VSIKPQLLPGNKERHKESRYIDIPNEKLTTFEAACLANFVTQSERWASTLEDSKSSLDLLM